MLIKKYLLKIHGTGSYLYIQLLPEKLQRAY